MSSAPGGPPQIIRRNDGGTNNPSATSAPGIPETSSNLSSEAGASRLSTVPSHDNSSHSGSEKGIERMNPFEQGQMNMVNPAPRGPLEQIGSHHSASPERAAAATTTTTVTTTPPQPPSSPAQMTQVASMPRSPAPPLPQQELPLAQGGPQMPTTEEDDITHSSSAVNSTEPASSYTPSTGSHQQQAQQQSGMAGSFVRFIESTRKRVISNTTTNLPHRSSEGDLIEDLDGMIIGGYLQKLGRNGKWQTRWFESDGECLSYYKNENRTKLLATLDLEKVGLFCMQWGLFLLSPLFFFLTWNPFDDFCLLALFASIFLKKTGRYDWFGSVR